VSSAAPGKHLGALVRPPSPSCSRAPVLPLARACPQERGACVVVRRPRSWLLPAPVTRLYGRRL